MEGLREKLRLGKSTKVLSQLGRTTEPIWHDSSVRDTRKNMETKLGANFQTSN
jgi:hypothetical protein